MDKFLIKSANVKFQENPSSWSRAAKSEQTDGHYEANRRFSRLHYEC